MVSGQTLLFQTPVQCAFADAERRRKLAAGTLESGDRLWQRGEDGIDRQRRVRGLAQRG